MIEFIKRHFASKLIPINGQPYITRYYIFPRELKLFGLFLQEFHSSDGDRDLHNHPWWFAVSFILRGSYVELRLNLNLTSVVRKQYHFNFIPGWCFHRITRIEPGLHTLFFVGPRRKQWGFLRARGKNVVFDPEKDQRS